MVTSEIVDYQSVKKAKVKSEPGSPQAAVTITFVFLILCPLTYLSCSIPAASSFVKTTKRKLSFGSVASVDDGDVPSAEEDSVLESPIALTPKRSRKPSAKAVYMTDDTHVKQATLVRLLYSGMFALTLCVPGRNQPPIPLIQ